MHRGDQIWGVPERTDRCSTAVGSLTTRCLEYSVGVLNPYLASPPLESEHRGREPPVRVRSRRWSDDLARGGTSDSDRTSRFACRRIGLVHLPGVSRRRTPVDRSELETPRWESQTGRALSSHRVSRTGPVAVGPSTTSPFPSHMPETHKTRGPGTGPGIDTRGARIARPTERGYEIAE
jgi:hypothetical protein